MAVGPTEVWNSGVLQIDPRNAGFSTRTMQIINALMRGATTATVNPSSAIVENGVGNVQDTGVGILLDLSA